MLNTYWHTQEDIDKAYSMTPETLTIKKQVDRDTYASILIFCEFDKDRADKAYIKLMENGTLYLNDVLDVPKFGGDKLGWEKPYGRYNVVEVL